MTALQTSSLSLSISLSLLRILFLTIAITFTLVIIEVFVLQIVVTVVGNVSRSVLVAGHTLLSTEESAATCRGTCVQIKRPTFLFDHGSVVLVLCTKTAQYTCSVINRCNLRLSRCPTQVNAVFVVGDIIRRAELVRTRYVVQYWRKLCFCVLFKVLVFTLPPWLVLF